MFIHFPLLKIRINNNKDKVTSYLVHTHTSSHSNSLPCVPPPTQFLPRGLESEEADDLLLEVRVCEKSSTQRQEQPQRLRLVIHATADLLSGSQAPVAGARNRMKDYI